MKLTECLRMCYKGQVVSAYWNAAIFCGLQIQPEKVYR